jgi:hypothetical protein
MIELTTDLNKSSSFLFFFSLIINKNNTVGRGRFLDGAIA